MNGYSGEAAELTPNSEKKTWLAFHNPLSLELPEGFGRFRESRASL
jgi:hypothetical protein